MSSDSGEPPRTRSARAGTGIGLGVALGVALGAAVGQVGLGLALGVAFGAAMEGMWRTRSQDRR